MQAGDHDLLGEAAHERLHVLLGQALEDLGAFCPRRLVYLDQPGLISEEPQSRPHYERPADNAGATQEPHQQDLGLAHHESAVEIEDRHRRRSLPTSVTHLPARFPL